MRRNLRSGKFSSHTIFWKSRTAANLVGVAMLFLAGIAPASLGQNIYSITNLGALGMSSVKGLNNRGEVAGGNGQRALLYSGGTIINLGTLGGNFSDATAINDSGHVVGTSRTAGNKTNGFLYSGGRMSDLGTWGSPSGSRAVAPTAINNSGVVVGNSEGYKAVIYEGGRWTNILASSYYNYALGIGGGRQTLILIVHPSGYPGEYYLHSEGVLTGFGKDYPTAINESGQVVGSFGGHAGLYSGGVANDLGTLGGDGRNSIAYAINNNGQIVGTSTTSNGTTRAFIYSEGTMRDLGSAPDLMITRFEWDTALGALQFTYTNSITPVGAGVAWRPIAINDQGQILRSDSFLLTPIEPSSTSVKLFWATGVGVANKISNTPIFTHTIPAGFTGGSAPVQVPASNLQNRPPSATHVLLVLNPENQFPESNTNNNTAALNITQPDILPATLAWNEANGLDFSYTVQPGTLGIGSTTAKLFWANGPGIANKLPNSAIFTQNIPAGFIGQSPVISVPSSSLQFPPTNATHILMVVDPDNLITESSENNNTTALTTTRPDLVPTSLAWNRVEGGLLFSYSVQPGNLGIGSTAVKLFWASGTSVTNILSTTPIFVQNITAGVSGEITNNQVAASSFANPPTNASHVLLVMDADNLVLESQEANNVLALSLASPVTLAFKRVDRAILDVSDDIDSPAVPSADLTEALAIQSSLGLGVVADGVTPVLLHLNRTDGVDQAASYQVELSIDGLVLNSVLEQRLRILSNGSWTPAGSTKTINFGPEQVNGFAFIEGIQMEEAMAAAVGGELTVTVKVKDQIAVLDTEIYKIRRPPVVLVHGYNTDKRSWVSPFTNVVNSYRPGFVLPISYGSVPDGKGDFDNSANTYEGLERNSELLDDALRSTIENANQPPLRDWYFLRYDVVAHSQGGVLMRMLCRKRDDYDGDAKFFSRRYPRGRFHRVITVGSIHNGSVLPYYAAKLRITARWVVPTGLQMMGILQSKFDPFGPQIRALNSALVDDRARFHCIQTSIDFNGNVPPLFRAAGLTQTRRDVLLPAGSDGVVDWESQGGGDGTRRTPILGENIAHSEPLEAFITSELLQFGGGDSDTHSATVANRTGVLLNGPATNFGPFINPINLSTNRKADIDAIIPPSVLIEDIIARVIGEQRVYSSYHYNFQAQTLPGDAADGPFTWVADVLGPNAANNSGVTLTVNTNDSHLVSVSVDDSTVIGDVVLYASYNSTNGSLVLGKPKLVASFPVGAALESLELRPRNITLELSNSISLEIWGSYTNGITRPLFTIGKPQFVFNSTAPSILAADTNGVVTAIGLGSATMQVVYQGLSNAATFTVFAAPTIIAHPDSRTNLEMDPKIKTIS